jgi:hypothetical protein
MVYGALVASPASDFLSRKSRAPKLDPQEVLVLVRRGLSDRHVVHSLQNGGHAAGAIYGALRSMHVNWSVQRAAGAMKDARVSLSSVREAMQKRGETFDQVALGLFHHFDARQVAEELILNPPRSVLPKFLSWAIHPDLLGALYRHRALDGETLRFLHETIGYSPNAIYAALRSAPLRWSPEVVATAMTCGDVPLGSIRQAMKNAGVAESVIVSCLLQNFESEQVQDELARAYGSVEADFLISSSGPGFPRRA